MSDSNPCSAVLRARSTMLGLGVALCAAWLLACDDKAPAKSPATVDGSVADTGAGPGTSDAGPSSPERPNEPAFQVNIVFPPPGAVTTAAAVTIRGEMVSSSPVAAVEVGGQEATSNDGFATFIATVPLEPGEQDIAVRVRDTGGVAYEAASMRLVRLGSASELAELASGEPVRTVTYGAALTDNAGALFVSDDITDSIAVVDLVAKEHALVAGDGVSGSAPRPDIEVVRPTKLAVSADGATVYALDAGPRILRVDTREQRWAILADAATGSGPLGALSDLVLDEAQDRILVYDRDRESLVAVSITTGNRVVLADEDTGRGPLPSLGTRLAVDFAGERAFVSEQYQPQVIGIDLASGDRALVVDGSRRGRGPEIRAIGELAFAAAAGRLMVWDSEERAAFTVDVRTGDRVRIADADTCPLLPDEVIAMDMGPSGWLAVVGEDRDAGVYSVVALDPVSGACAVLYAWLFMTF